MHLGICFLVNFLNGHYEITYRIPQKNDNFSWCAQKYAINECKSNFVARNYLHSFNLIKLQQNCSIRELASYEKYVNDPFWEVISDKMKIAQFPSCLSFIVPPNLKERRAICLHANIFGSDMIPRSASVRLSIQMYKKAHPYYQTILERKEDWGHGEA